VSLALADDALSLAWVEQFATSFAAEHLEQYTEQIRTKGQTFTAKEINDPLWGTISLTPIEVAFLDSPLLQRLRSIRQLGVIHWIYPSAVHTRFEHTLGVLHQVQHLTTAINALGIGIGQPALITSGKLQLLRLAGLLHDVGHGAFSHVLEKALERLPTVATISTEFSQAHQVEGKQLSEMVAYYVIRSKSFRDLITILIDEYGGMLSLDNNRSQNVKAVVNGLSNAIIGKMVDESLPLLHEIISGPFDADKLDYFVRDAKFAGTPIVTDISRLVQKLAVRELSSDQLPDKIAEQISRSGSRHFLFGVKWSGISTLDELHLSRVLLYAKIYRHPKVIAIEEMLAACLQTLAPITSAAQLVQTVYSLSDEALLSINRSGLIEALGLEEPLSDNQNERIECALSNLRCVKMRRLSIKAFQMQRRYPADPLDGSPEQREGIITFLEDVEHPELGGLFKQKLLQEVRRAMEAIGARTIPSEIALDNLITMRTLGKTPGGSQIARAYLLPNSGKPIAFRDYLVNRSAWADSYMSDQPAGYIFAPPAIADIVYVAAERILRTTYAIRLPSSALDASKRSSEQINALKQALGQKGYYSDAPFDVRAFPSVLRAPRSDRIIRDFSSKLLGYQEPESAIAGVSPFLRDPSDRIESWLRQFDDDELIGCALDVLTRVRIIRRHDTVQAVSNFVENHSQFRGAVVVPFGDARDSSAIQTYFAADLEGSHISKCKSLEEAAREQNTTPIIFVDDFLGSGGQTSDILAAGFGREDLRASLGEQRELFGDEVQMLLRGVPVGFVFTAAWDRGKSTLKAATEEHGLEATVYSHLTDADIPFAFEGAALNSDGRVVQSFKERCARVGRELALQVSEKTGPEADAKAQQRALGYGNRAMLLVSPFNVPTQCLTAFWAGGLVGGVPWEPLMPRRKKA